MKYPTRLSDAVHILAFIALYPNCDLTSNKLAESIQTNPAYVRQLMSALRKGGLLVSVKGGSQCSCACGRSAATRALWQTTGTAAVPSWKPAWSW